MYQQPVAVYRVSPWGVEFLRFAGFMLKLTIIVCLVLTAAALVVVLSPFWIPAVIAWRHQRQPQEPARDVSLDELFPSRGRWS